MSSRGKRKSAMMTAEVMPGPSSAVEAAISGGEGDGPSSTKKSKLLKDEPSTSMTEEEIKKFMNNTFDIRRNFINFEDPTVAIIRETYPYLFKERQILAEFERITEFDLDQTLQQYCVKNSGPIIELAKHCPGTGALLKAADKIKLEQPDLKQYWDMVTCICLLPTLLRENLVDCIIEIAEDAQVDAKGKIVPVLVSRGSVFKSDEFFLIIEEEVVQEYEEFTIAFENLFAAYWVFNMEYPQTLQNTYTFIQKAILKMKDNIPIPAQCKQLMNRLKRSEAQKKQRSRSKPE
ncbi:hypothetical protein CHS0354_009026 [Potamilus streckersoni]|uniref:Uncharacterized protein n=1 Tax=Potamilus streckersoni TaxID=2493646 RepID=A0AAE0TI02_9BIVA|nr:hypothetical protein CHS0354_009026 [Potamilus streckersoni]